jgi:hypothetical protein
MNNNEEVPDFLRGLGDMLPADVLKKVNELMEQLHRKDKDHQGSPVIIYAPGSQYVDKQINIGEKTLPKPETHPDPPCVGREKSAEGLPDELATDEAMVLWRKAQQAGYVNEHYQPTGSRPEAAILAYEMARILGIEDKWKSFETLWNRRNMYRDYHTAINQKKSLKFRDKVRDAMS